MHYSKVTLFILFFICQNMLAWATMPPPPLIDSIEILTPQVEQFKKFAAKLKISADYANPYNYEEVSIGGYFTSPSGIVDTIDGFYMQDFNLNENNGLLLLEGSGEFRVRYAPRETGTYSVVFTVKDSTGTIASDAYNFATLQSTDEENAGFVRTDAGSNYLKYDDGSSYIPLGENMAWQDNNPYVDYRNWVSDLEESGGNFIRLWHAAWGLGIEWKQGGSFQGLRKYKQTNSFYQDWLYDYCSEKGVYVMLALHYHGAVSTMVNPNWQDSPYNVINGGPCENTIDFFTNEEAIAHTKNRLRYIVARWGYAKNIMCWELFNEVLWTDGYHFNKELIAEWHFEMANYLKSIDPNQHLISTSYGEDWQEDEAVWSAPEMDFTQSHIYQNSANLENVLAKANRTFLQEFEKPTLNGEFGIGITGSLNSSDPDGIHIHNAIWGSLFSGGLGTAMTWWWDSYVHPQELYYHFTGIKSFSDQIDFNSQKMEPAESYVLNYADDLNLEPFLSWGGIGTDTTTILSGGNTSPSQSFLCEFLYGAEWNTQFRSPPTFAVTYPQEGQFSVTTGDNRGTNPILQIWVDDVLVLEDTALINTTYSVNIPEGAHIIFVDNQGTDWVKINNYSFEGLSSKMEAYVLRAAEKNYATGWVLQKAYNHQLVASNGLPSASPNTTVVVDDFADGVYAIHLFDPLTGAIISTGNPAVAANGQLEIPLPPLVWDVAFIIDESPVATNDLADNLYFKVYPNPVASGGKLNVEGLDDQTFDFALIDLLGRTVFATRKQGQKEISIPIDLATGHYWLKIEQHGKTGLQSLVVVKSN